GLSLVVSVAAGRLHSAAVTLGGDLYTWGESVALGVEMEVVEGKGKEKEKAEASGEKGLRACMEPRCVARLRGRVEKVACGASFTLAVCRKAPYRDGATNEPPAGMHSPDSDVRSAWLAHATELAATGVITWHELTEQKRQVFQAAVSSYWAVHANGRLGTKAPLLPPPAPPAPPPPYRSPDAPPPPAPPAPHAGGASAHPLDAWLGAMEAASGARFDVLHAAAAAASDWEGETPAAADAVTARAPRAKELAERGAFVRAEEQEEPEGGGEEDVWGAHGGRFDAPRWLVGARPVSPTREDRAPSHQGVGGGGGDDSLVSASELRVQQELASYSVIS
ncbi:hypothetical protein T484DRAFT_1768589, partial [Baffinella frigidus]